MLDCRALFADLSQHGLYSWEKALASLLRERFADGVHGDLKKWQQAVAQLPTVSVTKIDLNSSAVSVSSEPLHTPVQDQIRSQLLELLPWRKGPFNIHGINIDTEWRCNLKWDRLRDAISPLSDRRVLDVGCGNGYYALRMLGAGARLVIGVDPTLLYVVQFLAVKHFLGDTAVHVLPLRLNELPERSAFFETTFAMGTLYHQRDPHLHLKQLLATLRPDGELVLETLVLPQSGTHILQPKDRYARMRNVWHLPTIDALTDWLSQAGFRDIRLVDQTPTTPEEQRSTEWMPFESLAEALDKNDPSLTVEGLPAPTRAIVVCKV